MKPGETDIEGGWSVGNVCECLSGLRYRDICSCGYIIMTVRQDNHSSPPPATTFHTLLNTISHQTQGNKGYFAKNICLLYILYIIYFIFSSIAAWKDELTAQLWICVSLCHVNLSVWV